MLNKFKFWLINKLMKGGVNNMLLICVTLITYKYITFAQCPPSLQTEIRKMLLVAGLDENGNPIVTEL